MPVEQTGWLERVQLLDDVPIDGDGTRDFLGLTALAQNLAESLLEGDGRPMAIHVDGAWGRGKTSFCNCLRARLQSSKRAAGTLGDRVLTGVTEVGTAWYVASDGEGNAADAIMYQVIRATVGEDAEEIVSLMNRFSGSANPDVTAEPRFDAFRWWLSRELGWTTQHVATRGEIRLAPRGPSEAASTGLLTLKPRAARHRLAVVFIDDLDRCGPVWVAALLDTIRKYVNCRGIVFVIAADKRVISGAFEDVVQSLGVANRISGGEALEKYIRHSVQIPSWGINTSADFGSKLRDLQRALDRRGGELLPIILGPGRDLQLGVGFKLTLYLSDSLSPRRLKRLLTKFTVDVARFADLAGVSAEHLRQGSGTSVWQNLRRVRPLYGAIEARVENYAGFFFGRLITFILEELWPETLRDVALDSSEFEERVRSLAGLGNTLQAENDPSLPGMSLRMFGLAIEALVPTRSGAGTSLGVKRECCELLASLFADLERPGTFAPKRAVYFVPTPAEQAVAEVEEVPSAPAATIAPQSTPPHATSPFAQLERSTAVALLRKLRSAAEQFSISNSPLPWVRAIQVAQAIRKETSEPTAANLQLELAQWAEGLWHPGLLAIEYADELIRLRLHDPAFQLLMRICNGSTTLVEPDALVWEATVRLEQLWSGYPTLRSITNPGSSVAVPPLTAPGSAAAFRAQLRLALLQRGGANIFLLRPAHEETLISSVASLVAVLPNVAWPVRILVHLLEPGESQYLPMARAIASVFAGQPERYGLTEDDLVDLTLRLIVLLRGSTGDRTLALQLYSLLEAREGLPLSQLHNLALLKRQTGDFIGAALCWEVSYAHPGFPLEAEREFVDLLRQLGLHLAAEQVATRQPLQERLPIEGERPKIAFERTWRPSPLLSTTHITEPLEALARLREFNPADRATNPGTYFELALGLFRRARELGVPEDTLRIEAARWADPSPLDGSTHGRIELAELMLQFGFVIEARDGLRAGNPTHFATAPNDPDLVWLNWSVSVELASSNDLELGIDESHWHAPVPRLARAWTAASRAPAARGLVADWISKQLTPALWETTDLRWTLDWLDELSVVTEPSEQFHTWMESLSSLNFAVHEISRWASLLLRLIWLTRDGTFRVDTVVRLLEGAVGEYGAEDLWSLGRGLRSYDPTLAIIGDLWSSMYRAGWRAQIAPELSAWAFAREDVSWKTVATMIRAEMNAIDLPTQREYSVKRAPQA